MHTEKISISLTPQSLRFLEEYRAAHARKSRSQVIEEAIALLRQQMLEQAYRDASRETDPAWDLMAAEGLPDEAW